MRKTATSFFSVLGIALILAGGLSLQTPRTAKVQASLKALIARSGGNENPEEREHFEEEMLADPATGKIPAGIYAAEAAFGRELLAKQLAKQNNSFGGTYDQRGIWGPIGGRTRAFAIDVTNNNILLAGGVSGGLWRSTDAGTTWTRVTDRMSKPDVIAIAQDKRPGHTNTWYYLSGEAYGTSASGGSAFYLGDGMFKSTDGGLTWAPITSTASGTQNQFSTNWQVTWNVVTDPSNLIQDEVYAATYDAIYRSVDGGTSWTAVLYGTSAGNSYFTDVAVSDSGIVYAALSSDGTGRGIWRSADGITWTKIIPANFPSKYDRIKMAINPSNQNEVYFLCAATDTMGLMTINAWGEKEWNSLYKYTYLSGAGDSTGGTWTDLSMNLPHGGVSVFDDWHVQGSYNLGIKIKPNDPNTVFILGTNIYRSTDGFSSSNNTTQIGGYALGTQLIGFQLYPNHHPDQHDFWFDPINPDKVYSANDGGIYRCDSIMANNVNWHSLNNGYITQQLYTCYAAHDPNSDILIAGLQDNGVRMINSKNPQANWDMPFNGDGAYVAMSNDDQTYYLSIQQGKILKAKLNANHQMTQYARIDPSLVHNRDDYQFINPFVLDPVNDNIMYLPAGRKLFRNDDLSVIPMNNNNDSIPTNWIQFPDTVTGTAKITALAVSKNHRLYYGTSKRNVYRIDNANTGTPTRVSITGTTFNANGYVSCIAIDPTNDDNVAVVFSNYNVYSIFYSKDAGATWMRAAGNLEKGTAGTGDVPSIRWMSIMQINHQLKYFVGTSIGLFSADSLELHDNSHPGTQWTQEGVNEIGQTIVPYLHTRQADQFMAVATHGSGVYSINFPFASGIKNPLQALDIKLSPNPSTTTALQFNNSKACLTSVMVYDMQGKLFFADQFQCHAGTMRYELPMHNAAAGTYLVKVTQGKEHWNGKWIKSN